MPCFGGNEVTRGHDPVTETAVWHSGSIPLWPRLGDAWPCTGAWSTLLPGKGTLSLSEVQQDSTPQGKPGLSSPGPACTAQRESAWDSVIGQLACNEHLLCLGFLYFRRAPLLSTMGKRTFASFFHRWQSSHCTFSFGAGRTAEGGRHRCGNGRFCFTPALLLISCVTLSRSFNLSEHL